MSNQPPPQMGNQGESQGMPYGHPAMGGPPVQGSNPHMHPGMMPMGPGMPYPAYMMFQMGGPFYMAPPHPDMPGGQMPPPPPEMQFQPHMMPMPYGFPSHPMAGGHPGMGPPMPSPQPRASQPLNPNVPQFVPASSKTSPLVSRKDTVVSERASVGAMGEAKSTSRRLPIIDPTTGQEISFQPSATTPSGPPASALTTADIVLGTKAPAPAVTPSQTLQTSTPTVAPVEVSPKSSATTPELAGSEATAASGGKRLMKLKNAPLAKPVPKTSSVEEETASRPSETSTPEAGGVQRKMLKGIKNMSLVRKPTTNQTTTPPLETSSAAMTPSKPAKFKLVNKALTSTSSAPLVRPTPTMSGPITREMMLRYLPVARPDRNAPSSINVFPSELLGLRTAPHSDPGLALGRNRRAVLQKTMSAVSSGSVTNWRAGKPMRGLARQTSRGGRMVINQIVRPSERGFKIIDQSSLSEKDKLRRQTMSLLNKITVDSIYTITNQIAEIEITQPWQMDVVIGLIFDKAVVEHHYSEMYAEMCKKLRNTWPELTGIDQETGQSIPVTFTRAIIEKCQVEFDAIPDTLDSTEADIAKARGNPDDLELLMMKRKERILGNMKFIAQLFLARILSSRVVRSVVEQLLFRTDEPEEHYIECVGILLHNIGTTLMESDSGRAYIGQFVDRMQDLCTREVYGKRIKFMMKDVIDAAEAGWTGKHSNSRLVTAAKSKEAVRKDAQDELTRKTSAERGDARRAESGRYSRDGYSKNPGPPGRTESNTFRPAAVLKRQTEAQQRPAEEPKRRESKDEEEEWSDNEEDEVSEYAPGSSSDGESEEHSEEDAFTEVPVRR